MNIKEQIRAEIERRIDACYRTDGRIAPPRTRNAIVIDEFQDLLAFLDTLQEQPVGGLEESGEKIRNAEVILNGHGLLVDVTKWADGYKLKVIVKDE